MRSSSFIWKFGITVLAIFFSSTISAQTISPTATPSPSPTPVVSKTPSLEHQFFKNILLDQKAIWTAPLHLDRSDTKWLAPIGLGTMALITTDRITGDEIGEFHSQLNTSRVISYGGSTSAAGVAAASFYFAGRATHNSRARETGLLIAEASLDGVIVDGTLKAVTQRGRPLTGQDRSEFFDGGSSFPSGHSIQAWATAAIVADEYHDHKALQFAAYGLASAVSLSRFTGRNHYLSDVLVGSLIGYGIGQYVYHAHHVENTDSPGEEEKHQSRWPEIEPQYNRRLREYGVALLWKF
ncbi:MAG TPA: phosphatase PAP2 family protein [Pyrinomonadaceae bacterium]|nr:phosphatase PAP2 family protein [Pyrinomonadaceae bacterium]